MKVKIKEIDIGLNPKYINQISKNKLNEVDGYLTSIRSLQKIYPKNQFNYDEVELKILVLRILNAIVNKKYEIGNKNMVNIIKLIGNKKIKLPLKEKEEKLYKLIENYIKNLKNKNEDKIFLETYTQKMNVRNEIDLGELFKYIKKKEVMKL